MVAHMTATPAPQQPSRAAVIAAIHASARFLNEHPEFPTPTQIEMGPAIITERDEVDEQLRVAGLLTWAAVNEASLFEGSHGIMATAVIADREVHGVEITYRRFVTFDNARVRRYVP